MIVSSTLWATGSSSGFPNRLSRAVGLNVATVSRQQKWHRSMFWLREAFKKSWSIGLNVFPVLQSDVADI